MRSHEPQGDHLFKQILHQDLGARFYEMKDLGASGVDAQSGQGVGDPSFRSKRWFMTQTLMHGRPSILQCQKQRSNPPPVGDERQVRFELGFGIQGPWSIQNAAWKPWIVNH